MPISEVKHSDLPLPLSPAKLKILYAAWEAAENHKEPVGVTLTTRPERQRAFDLARDGYLSKLDKDTWEITPQGTLRLLKPMALVKRGSVLEAINLGSK
jgi:hypothetical protein